MTKEEEFVVNPLCKWFHRQKAKWKAEQLPHGKSQTGWDIEARRKNKDLLIEAKYIDKQSITSAIAGLVLAPLSYRPQRNMKTKDRSWCHSVCWAIGIKPNDKRHLYQAMFDYFARNPIFWKHYCKDLRLKYIFFVRDGKVAQVPFDKILDIAVHYGKESSDNRLKEKRAIANTLMAKYKYS